MGGDIRMVKKYFVTIGYQAILSYVFLVLPYLGFITFLMNDIWWFYLFAPIISYFLYATIFHRYIRLIVIKDTQISATQCFTPIDALQHKAKILFSDVESVSFGYVQGDSKGKKIYHAWDIPCLVFTMSDNSIERIVLCGYSKKQIIEIESLLRLICGDKVTNTSNFIV